MSTQQVTLFKNQMRTGKRTWFWLVWDGTANMTGDCNQNITCDQDLQQARTQYRQALNAYHTNTARGIVRVFWLKGQAKTARASHLRLRNCNYVSVRHRMMDAHGGVLDLSPYPPRSMRAYVRIGLKRFHRIRTVMLRVYQTNGGRVLRYQEILDEAHINKLLIASPDDNTGRDEAGNAVAPEPPNALHGDFEFEIWASTINNHFQNCDANTHPATANNGTCVNDQFQPLRPDKHGGAKNKVIAAAPAVHIPQPLTVRYILPRMTTGMAFTNTNYHEHQGARLVDPALTAAVRSDIDDCVDYIFNCIADVDATVNAFPATERRVLVLPEWFFRRTVHREIEKRGPWCHTEGDLTYIVNQITAGITNTMQANQDKWIIVPGSILWAKQPVGGIGQQVVFNTVKVFWRQGGNDGAHYTYHKSKHGHDTPMSVSTKSALAIDVGPNDRADLHNNNVFPHQNIPQAIRQAINGMWGGGNKTLNVIGETQPNSRWEVEAECGQHRAIIIVNIHTNNTKFDVIPRDYYWTRLRDAEWQAWFNAGPYNQHQSAGAFATSLPHFFTARDVKFALDICTECEHGFAFRDLGINDRQAYDHHGVPAHLIVAAGANHETGYRFSPASDNGRMVISDGVNGVKIKRIQRSKPFERFVDLLEEKNNNLLACAGDFDKWFSKHDCTLAGPDTLDQTRQVQHFPTQYESYVHTVEG